MAPVKLQQIIEQKVGAYSVFFILLDGKEVGPFGNMTRVNEALLARGEVRR